ncbi:cation transporter [candidate division KSB1 bacterium]|nr:cation transporter [candidate division KSB1 bacterium]MBL7092491.1 cation transporter [candidate division KSB1 bacterium]
MKNESKKLSYIEGWLSIIVNVLLFGLKYWAGIVTGSIAIIADAWHTLTDSISSIIVLIGVKVSSKPADKNHPFGHGRAELIASLIIGILFAIVAFSFIQQSIEKLKNREAVVFGTFAIVVTIISIVSKEALAQFAFWAGKKTGSTILKADAWHHRSDAISSVIILVGIFLGKYFWWIDGVLGIIVALLIFYATFEIFRDSINPMLGTSPDKNLIQKVEHICQRINSNTQAHHFHIHEYGNHTELTFHIYLPNEICLDEAHKISEQIEVKIRKNLAIESTIHMEPFESE